MSLPQHVAELDLRRKYIGTLRPASWRAAVIAPEDTLPEEPLIREIAAMRARGVRVLVVTLESDGGDVGAAFALAEALQRFALAGGHVVVHAVGWCASSATIVALAGDYLVMDPAAALVVHSMLGPNAQDLNRRVLEFYAPRVLTPRDLLAEWLTLSFPHVARLEPAQALNHGWADMIAGRNKALHLASYLAHFDRNQLVAPRIQRLRERAA